MLLPDSGLAGTVWNLPQTGHIIEMVSVAMVYYQRSNICRNQVSSALHLLEKGIS
jgi:hypothetical protein